MILLAQLENQFLINPTFSLQTLSFHLQTKTPSLSLIYALTCKLVLLSNPTGDDSNTQAPEVSDSDSADDEFGEAGLKAVINEMKGGLPSSLAAAYDTGIAKGGEVLSIISSLLDSTAGNPTALALYSTLLLKASQPYAAILCGWISKGVLEDPFEEFMVKESKSITKSGLSHDYTDEYWERRYTLRDGTLRKGHGKAKGKKSVGVPPFLERWKGKILLAGKYLNVIRECGIEIEMPEYEVVQGEMGLNDEA